MLGALSKAPNESKHHADSGKFIQKVQRNSIITILDMFSILCYNSQNKDL